MARSRNIKPGFFTNEDLTELPFEDRLLFIGLWTLADREGRLEDRPRRIKIQVFPYDNVDVEVGLSRLADIGVVVRYEVDGLSYIHIANFAKHQNPHYKEVPSEIPPPPGIENSDVVAPPTSKAQRERILERDGYKCRECGSVERLQVDHILPKSRGGLSTDDNLQVLCIRCNTSKGNRVASSDLGQSAAELGSTSNRVRHENRADSLNLIPDTGYLIPDCGDARESALSPPEQTIPISEPDQNAFQRRFGKPAPFTLLAALCDELGVYTDDLSKTDRGRQEAIARKLIADGTTPDDVRRMVRWLQGQSWVTGGIDLGLIQKQRDKWVLAGKPDTASKPRSPTQSRRGFTPEELFAMAREEPDDERTRNDASFGGAEYRLAGEADHTRDDSGVPLGAGGSAIRGGQTGSGGLGAIREVVPETG